MTLRETHEKQAALSNARMRLADWRDSVERDATPREREMVGWSVDNHPEVRKALAEVAALEPEVAALQESVGGRVFRIADFNLDSVKDKIEKLNKRARKLGVEEVTLTVSGETDEVKMLRDGFDPAIDDANDPYWAYYVTKRYIAVSGTTPKLDGWSFVATLDHDMADGAFPVIRRSLTETAQGVDLDAYRHAENRCDHCGFLRQRIKTYIVLHDDGRVMQVGSTCIKDFLGGVNPEQIARWAEIISDFSSYGIDEGDDFEGGYGPIDRHSIDLRLLLTVVVAEVREHGWRARWRDGFREHGTVDEALGHLGTRQGLKWMREHVTDDDAAAADAALAWVDDDLAKRSDLSEFEHNMVALTGNGRTFIKYADAGIAGYLPVMHARFLGDEVTRKATAKVALDSDHFGDIGDRVKLTFTVTFTRAFEGFYGVRYLTKGLTPDGDLIEWWGSGVAASDREIGETISCTATIKDHGTDKFNGDAKCTSLKNVRSVKQVEAEGAGIEIQKTAEQAEIERELREQRAAEKAEAAERAKLSEEEAAREEAAEMMAQQEAAVAKLDDHQVETYAGLIVPGANMPPETEFFAEALYREKAKRADMECLDRGDDCKGPVEYRTALSATGKSFPRCEHHWDARLAEQERISERYPDSPCAPVGFDPGYAGETWDDE